MRPQYLALFIYAANFALFFYVGINKVIFSSWFSFIIASMAGIQNARNYCFFNTIVQCISNCNDVRNYLWEHYSANMNRSSPHEGKSWQITWQCFEMYVLRFLSAMLCMFSAINKYKWFVVPITQRLCKLFKWRVERHRPTFHKGPYFGTRH